MILQCPFCHNTDFTRNNDFCKCNNCLEKFTIENNIVQMFTEDNAYTNDVKSFYEETPFPKYNDIDTIQRLIKRAEEGNFVFNLNEQLESGINILEAGCGTGQMSIYLSLNNRNVYATDMSLSSLKLASEFSNKHHINNISFYQMNIFNPIFKNESFDVLISNGVLHHTHDTYEAFKSLLPLVKKDGYIIIGLYHKYGRIWTDIRRHIFNLTGNKFRFLDEVYRDKNISDEKKESWFNDQYKHKHERKHTILEVMKWFENNNCQVLNVLPNPTFSETNNSLFYPRKYNTYEVFINELLMTFSNTKEGGFFTIIGKKN